MKGSSDVERWGLGGSGVVGRDIGWSSEIARARIGVWEEKSSRSEERSTAEVDFWTFLMISMAQK